MNDIHSRLDEALSPTGERALAAIAASPGVVLLLGGSDTGKTTWGRHAAMWLGRQGCLPLAFVDADIGQASLGPPAAVALSILRQVPSEGWAPGCLRCDTLSFVGSVSPMGHALQMLVSTKRLVDRAQQTSARIVLIDTTGLVAAGFGFQIKLRKIELVNPAHLVVFERQAELEPLVSVVSERTGLQVHRLTISESVRHRTPAERSAYPLAVLPTISQTLAC
jgi:polynucleotide 5'-hydroxyl-kinase GRC3/NOL9